MLFVSTGNPKACFLNCPGHAPQYAFRGMCMDLELMDWLNRYTFPEEEKYVDLDYAEKRPQRLHLPRYDGCHSGVQDVLAPR